MQLTLRRPRRHRHRPHFAALFESLEIRRLLVFHIGSLTDAPDPCPSGQALTLTANDIGITGGQPFEIDFYRETNGTAGLQPLSDLLLDFDDDPTGGYSAMVPTTGLAPGNYTYYARGAATGDAGGVSNTVTATNTVVPAPPSIAALVDSPDPVLVGSNVTLTATGVSDTDSPIAGVSFYREFNGTPGLQPDDTFMGADNNGADGWTFILSTIRLVPGTYTYYAVALDTTGLSSTAVSTTNTVSSPPDRFEPNDTIGTATNLGTVNDLMEGALSLHTPGDVDFFRLFTDRATRLELTLSCDPQAPMTLIMYDVSRHEIDRTTTNASGYGGFVRNVGADEGYYFEFRSATGAANSLYGFRIVSTTTIASVSASPNPVLLGAPFTLTASGVVDEAPVIVSFYRESNGTPGFQQNDELLGEDADPSDGYSIAATAQSVAGTYTYYAVGRDIVGFSGNPVSTTLVVKNHPPSIASLSASPYPASPGGKITLTANGVSNPDGNSLSVTFYVESNGQPGLQPVDGDKGLATDDDGSDGYSYAFLGAGLLPKSYTYYAYAEDPDTGASAAGADAPKATTLVPLSGDANLDGTVNFPDLVTLAQNYGSQGKDFTQGDFNYDTKVDFNDLVMLAQRYGSSLAGAPILSATETVAPASSSTASSSTKNLFSVQPVKRPLAKLIRPAARRR